MKEEYRPIKDISFNQANKKDAYKVTAGKYTMSTTKKGRYIHRSAPYDVQLKKLWRIGRESGRLGVNYRMGHTLEKMDIEMRPTDWNRVIVRKSSSSPPNSPPSSPTSSPSSPPGSPSSPPSSPSQGSVTADQTAAQNQFVSSRSSSPDSPIHQNTCSSQINFTSTEIKQEVDQDSTETRITSLQPVAMV